MDLIKKICCFCARRPQGEFKILILGLDNAGKTTLLYKISCGDDVHTVPTIGYNAEEMRWKNFRLVLWDIGGQNELRPAWNTYFSSSSGVIIAVDSTDLEKLPELKSELNAIANHEELRDVPFLILANKQDAPGAVPPSEISMSLDLPNALKFHSWRLQACSATTGTGLKEGMEWLATLICAPKRISVVSVPASTS